MHQFLGHYIVFRRGCGATSYYLRQYTSILLCIGRAAGRQVASLDTILCLGGAVGATSYLLRTVHDPLLCIGRAAGRQEGLRGNKLLPRAIHYLLLCLGRAAGRQVTPLDSIPFTITKLSAIAYFGKMVVSILT